MSKISNEIPAMRGVNGGLLADLLKDPEFVKWKEWVERNSAYTNYEKDTDNGTVYFGKDKFAYDDQQIVISSVRLSASSSPTWTSYKGSQVLAFSPTQDNKIFFTAQYSHRKALDNVINDFHNHLTHPDANTGNSVWLFTESTAGIGEVWPTETEHTKTVAAPGVADMHGYADIAEKITIAGTETVSTISLCSLTRVGTDGDDNYANDIYLIASDFHIKTDSYGSGQEASKK